MKKNRTRLSSLLFAGVLLLGQAAVAAPAMHRSSGPQYVPGEVLVKFKPAVSAQARVNSVSAKGGIIRGAMHQEVTRIRLASGRSVDTALAEFIGDPNVEFVQPNYIYRATAIPNDPDYGQQWGHNNTRQTILSPVYATNNPPASTGNDMNMQLAWDHITDCSSVVVAVIDTGVNYTHQDLANNMWNGGISFPNHGYNYTSEGAANDPMDLHGHGTHVAGIIGAQGNNSAGTTGVCWRASIMAVRALDSTGAGTTASIISAIHFAVDNGAKVINMSLGMGGPFDQLHSDAITYAMNHDVVVVVAASNDGTDNDLSAAYPCNFAQPNLVCVAALDQNYQLATFSNWGNISVDVGAPGTNILSSWAGIPGVVSDPLDGTGLYTSWQFPSTTSSTFGYGQSAPAVSPYNGAATASINLPGTATWPAASSYVAANTDARLWTTLNLSGLRSATLDVFGAAHVVDNNGSGTVAMAYSSTGGDPFAPLSPSYFSGTTPTPTDPGTVPATTPVYSAMPTLSLYNCLTASCTVGVQFTTGSESMNLGVSIVDFTLNLLAPSDTVYTLENGTSMATPAVAGLAAMLRAYNPSFTYSDTVTSIKSSGRATASLSGKTSSGRAVDAMKALSYINKPTGLAVTIQ